MVFDRHYCSYLNIAQMMALGIHSVSRLHQGRKVDLPEGVNDKVVEWTRPLLSRCPDYISRDEWQQMPQKLHVRYIRICLQQQGFRPEHIIIAHNLIPLDPYASSIPLQCRSGPFKLQGLSGCKAPLQRQHIPAQEAR